MLGEADAAYIKVDAAKVYTFNLTANKAVSRDCRQSNNNITWPYTVNNAVGMVAQHVHEASSIYCIFMYLKQVWGDF